MLVLHLAIKHPIDEIKAHNKNLLKVLEISHYAYELCNGATVASNPPSFKLNQIHNITANALGFKSLAAMQAYFQNNKTIHFVEIDHPSIKTQILKLSNLTNDYADFITNHYVEYLIDSGLLVNQDRLITDINTEQPLEKYLPMLRYFKAAPLLLPIKKIVEASLSFTLLNIGLELTTQSKFSLSGWINVFTMNNLIPTFIKNISSDITEFEVKINLLFGGRPRTSNFLEILSYLNNDNGYYTVYSELNKTSQLPQDWKLVNDDISEQHIKIRLAERSLALFKDFTHLSTQRNMLYDAYGIADKLKEIKKDAIAANIFEATDYFLTTCFNHLKDLNPILHYDNLESMLSVRDESVNELSWRRHITDYAEVLISTAKGFFESATIQGKPLSLDQLYFNDFGFMMFETNDDVYVSIKSHGFEKKFSPYNFSIFFNLFVNLLLLRSEVIRNEGRKHLLSMCFVMLNLAKQPSQLPVFNDLKTLFDLDLLEDALNLALGKFELIEYKAQHLLGAGREFSQGAMNERHFYALTAEGFGSETMLLGLIREKMEHSINAEQLLQTLMSFKIDSTVVYGYGASEFTVCDHYSEFPPYSVGRVKTKTVSSQIETATLGQGSTPLVNAYSNDVALIREVATARNTPLYDLSELLLWVSGLFKAYSYTHIKKLISQFRDVNSILFVLLDYALNMKNTHSAENCFKTLRVRLENELS